LPDFSWYNIPKRGKNYQSNHKAPRYTKWLENRPNGQKIYRHLQLQDPPKFTQLEIFGLKICHLATLLAIVFNREVICFVSRKISVREKNSNKRN
jgi:hypothetical protein